MDHQGGCLCGAVRYVCSEAHLAVYNCHCRDCQKASGAAFATCLIMKKSAVQVTTGQPCAFEVESEGGKALTRLFCGNCGSQLFSTPSHPKLRIVKAGTLDDPSWLKPEQHIWTSSMQPWLRLDDQLPCHAKAPPGW